MSGKIGERSTNLSLGKNWKENKLSGVAGTPSSDKYKKNSSVRGSRFNKHSDNGLVQSASLVCSSHGISNIPTVQEESGNDHECEEGVKRKGNPVVWRAKIWNGGAPDGTVRLRSLVVDEGDAHGCTNGISCSCRLEEN